MGNGELSPTDVDISRTPSPQPPASDPKDIDQESSARTTPEVDLSDVKDESILVENATNVSEENIQDVVNRENLKCTSPRIVPNGRGGEEDDDVMTGLVEHLDRVLEFQEQNTANPRYFDVPKGYAPRHGCLPGQFYQQKALCQRVDKRKRDNGILDKNSKLKRHGFRPEELIRSGALDLEDCRPSNLDNPIHPIFDSSRFDECPDHIYEEITPALRLASKFLTEPVCCQFWVTLAKGERVVDAEMSSRLGHEAHRIRRNVPLTEDNVSSVVDLINSHGQRRLVHFVFRPKPNIGINDTQLGTQHTICDYKVGLSEGLDGELCRSVITLHSDLYIAAAKFSKLKYPDESQKLRFSFLLAILLVHELCHAVHATHDPPKRQMHDHMFGSKYAASTMCIREPFVLEQTEAEVGAAWERQMFGGKIDSINGRLDGQCGLSITNWPYPVMDYERRELFAISMSYIENLFQKETWEHKFNLKQLYFRIPRDGASSIYLNCYTTMSHDEESRIAQEEAREAEKDIVKAEGSKKKRLLSSGEAIATALPQDEGSTKTAPSAKASIEASDSRANGNIGKPTANNTSPPAPSIKTVLPEKKRTKKRRPVVAKRVNNSPIGEHVSTRQAAAIEA